MRDWHFQRRSRVIFLNQPPNPSKSKRNNNDNNNELPDTTVLVEPLTQEQLTMTPKEPYYKPEKDTHR